MEHPGAHAGFLAAFIDFFGFGIVLPFLPFVVASFKAQALWVGAIVSAQYFGSIVGSVLWGRASDTLGRKTTVVATLVGDAIVFSLSAFAWNVESLVALRFLAGLTTPLAPAQAWVASCSNGEARAGAMANYAASCLAGVFFGGVTGAAVATAGWWGSCFTSGGVAATGALYICLRCPAPPSDRQSCCGGGGQQQGSTTADESEPQQQIANDNKPEGLRRCLASKDFLATGVFNLACGLNAGNNVSLGGVIFMEVFGFAEAELAIFYGAFAATLLLTNVFVFRPLHRRVGGRATLVLAGLLAATANGVQWVFVRGEVFAGFFLCGICSTVANSMSMPTTRIIATEIAEEHGTNCVGSVLGVSQALFNAGQLISPLAAIALYEKRVYLPFVIMAVMYLAGTLSRIAAGAGMSSKERAQQQHRQQQQEEKLKRAVTVPLDLGEEEEGVMSQV